MRKSCFVLIVAVLLDPTFQASPAQSKTEPKAGKSQVLQSTDSLAFQMRLLDAQLRMAIEYNDRILQTVYWALGSMASFLLILVGFNWYTNYRIYDRDKQALMQELSSSLQAHLSEHRIAVQTEINAKFKEISDSTQGRIDARIAILDETLAGFKSELFDLRFAALKSEFHYWELKGVRGNMLAMAIQMLSLSLDAKTDPEIGQSLAKITDLLKQDTPVMVSETYKISSMLDSLPTQYATEVNVIRAQLVSIRGKTST